ncbi:MAG: peptide chain release factor 1 [Bacteroidetes bacterium]|nr:peptide chain release factor 1 [Bacteroidota bacterium]
MLIDKLELIKQRYKEVESLISNSEVLSDMKKYKKLSKEYKDLGVIVEEYEKYKKLLNDLDGSKEVLKKEKDQEFKDLAKEEINSLEKDKEIIEQKIKQLLIPKDPNDNKNIVIEIRAGSGGDEAGIFAGDLFRMYKRFAEKSKWKFEVLTFTESSSGGYKEIISSISGDEVYGKMKYESGVHRVQRIPATETQGRVHTSAASVIALPEAEDVEINLDMNDIRKDTFCSSGPGGQSVNTTYSAVRLTHIPTGIVVSCQDEKSQLKNFDKALKVLKARLYEIELKKQQEAMGSERKSMVRTGDRSEKIRTYNYPQGRVTDHRINFTTHTLPAIMDGDIGNILEALRLADNADKLKEGEL